MADKDSRQTQKTFLKKKKKLLVLTLNDRERTREKKEVKQNFIFLSRLNLDNTALLDIVLM